MENLPIVDDIQKTFPEVETTENFGDTFSSITLIDAPLRNAHRLRYAPS